MLENVQVWIYGAAALIDTVLLFALLERHNWRGVTIWMVLLAIGVWSWHGGAFARQLVEDSVGPLANPVRWMSTVWMSFGMMLMPSAALHAIWRLRKHGQLVLAPAFDPLTRTLDAEVHLDNREGTLRPGMYGRGAVVLAVHPGAVTVPVEAVQFTERGRFAFTARDGVAHRVAVEVGVDGGEWLEITRGLTPGDAVIVAGADALSDGAPVRVATPSTSATSSAPRAH